MNVTKAVLIGLLVTGVGALLLECGRAAERLENGERLNLTLELEKRR